MPGRQICLSKYEVATKEGKERKKRERKEQTHTFVQRHTEVTFHEQDMGNCIAKQPRSYIQGQKYIRSNSDETIWNQFCAWTKPFPKYQMLCSLPPPTIHLRNYTKDNTIVRQGEPLHGFYILKEGSIWMQRKEQSLEESSSVLKLYVGDGFGEIVSSEVDIVVQSADTQCWFFEQVLDWSLQGILREISQSLSFPRTCRTTAPTILTLFPSEIPKKTPEETHLLQQALSKHPFLSTLQEWIQTAIIDQMWREEVAPCELFSPGSYVYHFCWIERGLVIDGQSTTFGNGDWLHPRWVPSSFSHRSTDSLVSKSATCVLWMFDIVHLLLWKKGMTRGDLHNLQRYLSEWNILFPLFREEQKRLACCSLYCTSKHLIQEGEAKQLDERKDQYSILCIEQEGKPHSTEQKDFSLCYVLTGTVQVETATIHHGEWFLHTYPSQSLWSDATGIVLPHMFWKLLPANMLEQIFSGARIIFSAYGACEIASKRVLEESKGLPSPPSPSIASISWPCLVEKEEIIPTTYPFSELQPIRCLGRGSFGRVYEVFHPPTTSTFAFKLIHRLSNKTMKNLIQERLCLWKLTMEPHPHTLSLISSYRNAQYAALLLPFVRGYTIYQLLQFGTLTESVTKFICACVLEALHKVHQCGFLYRDVKAENVMIDEHGWICLVDYGLVGSGYPVQIHRTVCGTSEYMAPEVYEGQKYTEAADLWSLGILAYEMLMGIPPYCTENYKTRLKHFIRKEFEFQENLSWDAKQFICGLLEVRPSARLTLQDIYNHPWFQEVNFTLIRNRSTIQGLRLPSSLNTKELASYVHIFSKQYDAPQCTDILSDTTSTATNQPKVWSSLLDLMEDPFEEHAWEDMCDNICSSHEGKEEYHSEEYARQKEKEEYHSEVSFGSVPSLSRLSLSF